jgi:hypothetical protein
MIKQRVHVCGGVVALRILFLPPCACQHGMKNEREMIFARDEMGNFSFSRVRFFHCSKVILTLVGVV